MPTPPENVQRIIGVYDADSSVRGELSYWIGARLRRRHCSLCHITHGALGVREEWVAIRARLPVPFVVYHRDDVPGEVRALELTSFPVVLIESSEGVRVIMSPAQIAACEDSAHRFEGALLSRLFGGTVPTPVDD